MSLTVSQRLAEDSFREGKSHFSSCHEWLRGNAAGLSLPIAEQRTLSIQCDTVMHGALRKNNPPPPLGEGVGSFPCCSMHYCIALYR